MEEVKKSYYEWYYANDNPYPNGSFYSYEGGRWKEDENKDFAFITYGEPTGHEPDGSVDRWAVLIGGPGSGSSILDTAHTLDVTNMKNILVQRGWNPSHIWTIYPDDATVLNVKNAIEQMEKNEDVDDLCMISWSSHGATNWQTGEYYVYLKETITGSELDSWLDKFWCKGILLLASTCEAGGAVLSLAQPGRVIITAVNDEPSSIIFYGNYPNRHSMVHGWVISSQIKQECYITFMVILQRIL